MENLITIYCILLLCIVFTILGILLWNAEGKSEKAVVAKDNLLLACASLVAIIILHLNWLLLPWSKEHNGDLYSSIIMAILAIFCFLPIILLARNLMQNIRNKKRNKQLSVQE